MYREFSCCFLVHLFCPCKCRFHHCCSCHVGLKPVLFATQPKIRVVASSECQSCFVRCAVLCALPRRAVAVSLPVPVRLLVSCVIVTFRLFFRVSLPVCCGRYVCCSKPLTYHNGFMFFASQSCFKRFSRLCAAPLLHFK